MNENGTLNYVITNLNTFEVVAEIDIEVTPDLDANDHEERLMDFCDSHGLDPELHDWAVY